jgi:hypothetical protein
MVVGLGILSSLSSWIVGKSFPLFLASFLLIGAGLRAMRVLTKDSPLAPYALQILGLLFISPIILLLSATTNVRSDAITGLLGTIVGYIFGTASGRGTRQPGTQPKLPPALE